MIKNCEIFVSIASYRDEDLINTINDLYENAKDPDRIRVVVFNQTDFESDEIYKMDFGNRQVEIYSLNYKNTKGVSWIRHKIQTFIEQEKYYLQIDAHMRFGKDWDDKFIQYLKESNSKKPVLSFYPSAFDYENGKTQSNIIKNEIRAFNRKAVTSLGFGLDKNACNLDHGDNKPILGTTFAAGFVFAPIEYVKELPYDPQLYWNYEETDQTLRAFTNGWDFFGTPECLIWHKYNTGGGSPRHYNEVQNTMHRENKSNDHAEKKYFDPTYKTNYPLGTVRSLNEFEILNNLEFSSATLNKPEEKDILIVVPYRNREQHLKDYLVKTPKYFKDRGITYDILIAELDDIGDWNAGLSCNSVINFRKKNKYKFLYIHHVDVYPIDGEWKWPNLNEAYFNMGDYGSTLMHYNDFFKVGGYRNSFWGWGSEDNDLNAKLHQAGIKTVDVTTLLDYTVEYDTKYQNHNREFQAVNYSNSSRILRTTPNRNVDSMFDTNHYGRTHSLTKIDENIYKHNIEPLFLAPTNVKNKNVVITYIKDINTTIKFPFIKSVSYFASYNYDLYVIDASKEKDETVRRELTAFDFEIIDREPVYDNLFLDRLVAFKEFANTHDYETILCVDFSDIYFQGNPFEILDTIPKDNIIISSEGIPIQDQKWNYGVIGNVYGRDMANAIGPYEVLNCGVIAGNKKTLSEFADIVLDEYGKIPEHTKSIYGVDQAIILKLMYASQILRKTGLREDVPLAAHLHTIFNDPIDKGRFRNIQISRNKVVYNSNGELFKIVHQYNRSIDMSNEILRHFNQFYLPTW